MFYTGKQMHLLTLKMLLRTPENAYKRADYLKKKKVFHHFGSGCFYQPRKLPTEPELISIGDNVWISGNVRMITHDMTGDMLKQHPIYREKFLKLHSTYYMGKIEIGNNVVIGADVIILYDVKIGDDCIIAAGSIVTKDIPSGSVAAGVPAKVVGKFDEFVQKRVIKQESIPDKLDGEDAVTKYFWK
jgi:acetyltransferase-like isoleucine patch superfamily enzyme